MKLQVILLTSDRTIPPLTYVNKSGFKCQLQNFIFIIVRLQEDAYDVPESGPVTGDPSEGYYDTPESQIDENLYDNADAVVETQVGEVCLCF